MGSLRLSLCAVALGGCLVAPRGVERDDNLERIERGMRGEAFSDQTPGAEGIALGPESEPLAEPFPERPAAPVPLAVEPGALGRRGPYVPVLVTPARAPVAGCK